MLKVTLEPHTTRPLTAGSTNTQVLKTLKYSTGFSSQNSRSDVTKPNPPKKFIRELRQSRFWGSKQVNRKWTFCNIRLWFRLNLWANRLYKSKDNRENASIPVDVRHSKKPLFNPLNPNIKIVIRISCPCTFSIQIVARIC